MNPDDFNIYFSIINGKIRAQVRMKEKVMDEWLKKITLDDDAEELKRKIYVERLEDG